MTAFFKKNKWILITVCLAAILLTAGGLLVARGLVSQIGNLTLFPSNQVINFHTYYSVDPAVTGIILDDRRILTEVPPFLENDRLYLPENFIREHMDPFLFWDDYDKTVFVTTREHVLRFTPGADEFTVNDESYSLEHPVKRIDDVVYLPDTLVMALYPYHIQYKPASNLAVITTSGQEPLLGELTARANIRHRPDAQTAIVLKAAKGETLALYERENNFTRVRTTDGLLGFVLTEDITETEFMVFDPVDYLLSRPIVNTAPLQPMWPANKKINLMWEYMNNPDAVVLKMERPIPDGVDIISPKFFWLGEETLLESVASREYVNWAHEQGVQVWAMVQDIRSGLVHKAIADPASRRRLVRLLADYAREYNLDGINIDFEHISAREGDYYGPYFIQFLRELAVALRPQGVVLSVDVYVPSLWSAFYRRDLIALTADFLCVMTYDEHWAGGPSSGPVASLPFVYKGVSDMLEKEQVPKEQLLMGLPYYNRIWREVVNNDSPETRKVQHFTMERTKQLFTDRDIIPEWDAFIGSFYGEFAAVEDGETVLYRVWIEDEYSIAEKLKIFEAHDLAGVAGWQRGFENEAVQILLKRATDSQ